MSRPVSVYCDDPITAENVRSTLMSSGYHAVDVLPVHESTAGEDRRSWLLSEPGVVWSFLAGASLGVVVLVGLIVNPAFVLAGAAGMALGVSAVRIGSRIALPPAVDALPVLSATPALSEDDYAEEDTVLHLPAAWAIEDEAIPMLPDPADEAPAPRMLLTVP